MWLGYEKIKINEKWWRWNEEEEILRDKKENKRGDEQGGIREEREGGIR